MNLDTLSSDSSEEEIRDSGRSFQSQIVWGKKLDLWSQIVWGKKLDLWGPPGVLEIWEEGLFIFRELGSTANYLRGAGEQAHTFGDLGSTAKK